MNPRSVRSTLASTVLACLLGAVPAAAQIPDEFSNVQILPKDIPKQQMVEIMRSFSMSLGVRCEFCHVAAVEGSLEGMNFATDEREAKKVARNMMRMSDVVNKYMRDESGVQAPARVRCMTCHRGVLAPRTLSDVLLAVIETEGVDACIGRYRQLREKYHGQGTFDFSSRTLNKVAERVAVSGNLDGAITLVQLDLEFSPDSTFSHFALGEFYLAKEDGPAALAAFEKALEAEPGNPYARQRVEALRQQQQQAGGE